MFYAFYVFHLSWSNKRIFKTKPLLSSLLICKSVFFLYFSLSFSVVFSVSVFIEEYLEVGVYINDYSRVSISTVYC